MTKLAFLTLFTTTLSLTSATLPSYKIRGVNLGSLFIIEPWMSSNTWKSMGCGGASSEWDCVASLGQDKANAAFHQHWDTFITASDFDKMAEYGLNTVRVPVGHWFVEETIQDGENWPRGGMKYLDKVVGMAKERRMGVILDLHGAPGVQVPNNAFTGHVSYPLSSNTHLQDITTNTILPDISNHKLLHTLQLRPRLHLPAQPNRAHPHPPFLLNNLHARTPQRTRTQPPLPNNHLLPNRLHHNPHHRIRPTHPPLLIPNNPNHGLNLGRREPQTRAPQQRNQHRLRQPPLPNLLIRPRD
jgi:hypothetical protein